MRACVRARGLDGLCDDVVEQDTVLDAELQTTGVEPRDEEQISDEPLQTLGAAVHDREEALLLRRQLARLALTEHLEEPHQRRERRTQLVRDGGHEFVLQPVELALLRYLTQCPDAADRARLAANGGGVTDE